ncbi:hypothetical protein BU26DRAFT_525009 [Trematosphaeria pertusa]|uniref:Uncharacterized protein n=1 Tax=Trematosphaeria pertusa TaxID=390896 RepID=A0A6A6HUN5_9PLEO|nr:uncharacterized protein BU26DRAFT_525009 [Trematosphaeria pertusa]KAF2241895.1 hypothetical protein BU26DRAFT_525009 [Trematosphaeria pertusa]
MPARINREAAAVVQNCSAAAAIPITPPSSTGERVYHCNIEYHGQLYSLTWTGDPQYPDLSSFPSILAGELCLVKQSPKMLDLKVSFSGRLDEQIPSWFPTWVYDGATFRKDCDLNGWTITGHEQVLRHSQTLNKPCQVASVDFMARRRRSTSHRCSQHSGT